MFVFSQCVSWVVYHFYGQTIRFAVSANGKQNSVLVNSSRNRVYRLRTNQFHLPRNGGENLKLVSKVALKKRNTT